ncbi:MAG TPA: S1 RNA-binding domain-containing protein, partial [Candidatus Norongarragalinales archaeon]|nr:S1 RNA-binding domain-containing protein [Candidatus Norongarragalinales archaeon]
MFPQLEEFVVAKVKKLLPFGAIIELEEYGGLEGFVHISEVSSGWIRNIREHLKEGQVVVAKVIALDIQKRQV